jgi:hypothetical protein
VIAAEEKKKFIDLEDEDKAMEVTNEEEQENRDDVLNDGDSGSDYVSEDDKEKFVAEQKISFKEMNEVIKAQKFYYPRVTKLRSSIFRQPGSHQ